MDNPSNMTKEEIIKAKKEIINKQSPSDEDYRRFIRLSGFTREDMLQFKQQLEKGLSLMEKASMALSEK